MLELDQIFPGCAPRAGTDESAVVLSEEPIGMIFLQHRSPAGMVDDDIEKQASTENMCLIRQLAKLIDTSGAPIENNQCRIDGRQIERCVRAAKSAKSRNVPEGGITA